MGERNSSLVDCSSSFGLSHVQNHLPGLSVDGEEDGVGSAIAAMFEGGMERAAQIEHQLLARQFEDAAGQLPAGYLQVAARMLRAVHDAVVLIRSRISPHSQTKNCF
ncbi:MAG: hypothetical protein P8166_15925 [Candidatus Thiodiazotropha sp.]